MFFDMTGLLEPSTYDFKIDMDTYNPKDALEKGNTFKNLYSKYKNYDDTMLKPDDEKDILFLHLQELDFIINDLNLYLDIHPDDKKMLNLFESYVKKYKNLKEDYTNLYGTLCVMDTKDNFDWAKLNYPWEA